MMTLTEFQQKCENEIRSGNYSLALVSPIGMMESYYNFKEKCLNSEDYKNMNIDTRRQVKFEENAFYETIRRYKKE